MGIYALDWRTLLSAPASTPLPAEYSRRRVVLRDAMHRMSIMRASCVFISTVFYVLWVLGKRTYM